MSGKVLEGDLSMVYSPEHGKAEDRSSGSD